MLLHYSVALFAFLVSILSIVGNVLTIYILRSQTKCSQQIRIYQIQLAISHIVSPVATYWMLIASSLNGAWLFGEIGRAYIIFILFFGFIFPLFIIFFSYRRVCLVLFESALFRQQTKVHGRLESSGEIDLINSGIALTSASPRLSPNQNYIFGVDYSSGTNKSDESSSRGGRWRADEHGALGDDSELAHL
uniref:G protein-coupled receptor n=1 Tax=Plectus sambesii TaxID=2011161 RepID=A0A914WPV1_9BILA